MVAGEGVFEFEVAACGGVELQGAALYGTARRCERGQGGFVGVVQVLQQAAAGGQGGIVVFQPETGKGGDAEVFAHEACGTVGIEVPRGHAARAHVVGVVRPAAVFVDEHFAGAQAFDFAARFVGIEQGADLPVSSGEVCPGEGDAVFAVVQAEEDVVALFVQKCVVGNRAWGDDARNCPFYRPFACRRVADLFTKSNNWGFFFEAFFHQEWKRIPSVMSSGIRAL